MRDKAPRLLTAAQTGSRKVDRDGIDVKTMKEGNAPQHAMTPASYLSKTCDISCAKTRARDEAVSFVNTNLDKAKAEFDRVKNMADGDAKFEGIKKSLEYFGAAMHVVMDNRSPAHNDFQLYSSTEGAVPGAIVGGLTLGPYGIGAGAVAGVGISNAQHIYAESGDPTTEQENQMVDEIRYAFQQVYGQEAYARSVSEEERRATSERLSAGRPQGMLVP
jgi:hypothetical protein